MIIDLTHIQENQVEFVSWLENKPGMINEKNKFGLTRKQILATISELFEVGNEIKTVYKWWDKSPINKEKVLEELSDLLSHICNMANSLEEKLVVDIEVKQVDDIESQFISLTYDILRFTARTDKVFHKRRMRELVLPQFIALVYSLGFNLEELEEAYYKKLKSNYENPKFNQEVEQC